MNSKKSKNDIDDCRNLREDVFLYINANILLSKLHDLLNEVPDKK